MSGVKTDSQGRTSVFSKLHLKARGLGSSLSHNLAFKNRFFDSDAGLNSELKFRLSNIESIAIRNSKFEVSRRGCSSVGRAVALQAIGQEFESPQLHHSENFNP